MRKNNKSYQIDLSDLSIEEIEKKAYTKGADLLYRQIHTEAKLVKKLLNYGFPEEIVAQVIKRLKGKKYLNDYDYCLRTWELYLTKGENSLLDIRYKLLNKGFTNHDVALAQEELLDNYPNYEYQVCLRLLRMKYGNKMVEHTDTKPMAYLGRKGFNSSAIRYAWQDFLLEKSE